MCFGFPVFLPLIYFCHVVYLSELELITANQNLVWGHTGPRVRVLITVWHPGTDPDQTRDR